MLGLSFVLLMVVFRSLVVPLKAILMNLLSVGAAYGLMVAVFQKGWGADLLGLQKVDFVEAWVPLFLFAVLFGTSMDYHVFLLSRIRERFDQTGDNRESVAFGLRRTGGIITGAALIMVAVFGGFAAGDLVMFQQLGFGLAVAVFLDATIVRCVLVPAAMRLLGDRQLVVPAVAELAARPAGGGGRAGGCWRSEPHNGAEAGRQPRRPQAGRQSDPGDGRRIDENHRAATLTGLLERGGLSFYGQILGLPNLHLWS